MGREELSPVWTLQADTKTELGALVANRVRSSKVDLQGNPLRVMAAVLKAHAAGPEQAQCEVKVGERGSPIVKGISLRRVFLARNQRQSF